MFRLRLPRRSLAWAGLTGVLLLAVAPGAVTASGPDELAFVETDVLQVTFDSPTATPTELVAIANAGSSRPELKFGLLLRDGEDAVTAVTVTAEPRTVAAGEAKWFKLTFARVGDFSALDGFIFVTTADATATPAVRPIHIVLDDRVLKFRGGELRLFTLALPGGAGAILGIGFAIALLLVVRRGFAARWDLATKVGKPKWTYDSWASTLTGIGAVLGTLLGAGFFPKDPVLLTSGQFTGLNVLCGALILLAPFLYQSFASTDGAGNARVLLVAAVVSFTALFTELFAYIVATADSAAAIGSMTLSIVLTAVGAVLIFLALRYGWHALAVAFKGSPPTQMAGSSFELGAAPNEEREDWTLF